MTSSKGQSQGQGLEEISNLLGLVGGESSTSKNDYVTVSSLELVKKQLEGSYKEEMTALRREFLVEQEERKENERRLTKCIEKLMEEVLRLNMKITTVEEMKPPSSSTSLNASVEKLPLEYEIPESQPPKKKGKYKIAKNKKVAKTDTVALLTCMETSHANVEVREVRKSSRKGGPPCRFRDPNIVSSLSVSPSSTTSTDKDMDKPFESDTNPRDHDHNQGSGGLDNNPTSPIVPVPKAKDQTQTQGSEIYRNSHKNASTVGRYLPFLCICGLEFDSESSLSQHVNEKIVEEPNYAPTSPSSWNNETNNINFQIIPSNKKR